MLAATGPESARTFEEPKTKLVPKHHCSPVPLLYSSFDASYKYCPRVRTKSHTARSVGTRRTPTLRRQFLCAFGPARATRALQPSSPGSIRPFIKIAAISTDRPHESVIPKLFAKIAARSAIDYPSTRCGTCAQHNSRRGRGRQESADGVSSSGDPVGMVILGQYQYVARF